MHRNKQKPKTQGVLAFKFYELKSPGTTVVTEVYDTKIETGLHLSMVGKCHYIVAASEYRQIKFFYKIVKVYRCIYFTATFISYPHPSLHVNERTRKDTLIMSYQETFNVKHREWIGRGARKKLGKKSY